MKGFGGEILHTIVLGADCTKNVCSDTWMKCCLELFNKEDVGTVETTESSTLFKFGNDERVKSKILRKIPLIIACKKMFIETDAVIYKIPLLVRNDAMKNVERRINFATDIERNIVTQ